MGAREEMDNKKTILIVDDVELNREILMVAFEDEYHIMQAENGQEALDILIENKGKIAAVLLDLMMPVMDGFTLLAELKEREFLEKLPIFLITSETSTEAMRKGYKMGAVDFIGKPFIPEMVKQRIKNVIELYENRKYLNRIIEQQTDKIHKLNSSIIDTLSTAIEFRDCESGEHVKRIRSLTGILLKKLMSENKKYEIPEDQIPLIQDAAVMHDVGKIAIPDHILNKPGKLTKDEFEIMKTHTVQGCELLFSIEGIRESELYQYAYDICRHHHERWDGNGYPDGLKENEIPFWTQIVSLADVYDALVSKRVYKDAYNQEKAINMILNGECGVFNPDLLNCFIKTKDEVMGLYQE